MAQLRPLGQPFGSTSQIFNVPAPAGSAEGAFANQQAFQQIANVIAAKRKEDEQQRALQQFAQQQGINLPQGLPPNLTNLLIGQSFQNQPGFTLGQGQQRFDAQGSPIAQVAPAPTGQPGFTLSPGQQRFDTQGRPIAGVAPAVPTEKPRAGSLQIAKEGDASGLAAGTVFQADPQGNVKIISEPGGEGLSKADKTKIAVTQAKEFRTDERIKNFQIIERSERGMQAALKLSTSPNAKSKIASDQALGVLFQKMLDPTSVVRESEFARTPEGAALMSRLTSQIPKLVKGGLAISDSDRRALVTMAQKLLDEAKISANKAFDEFTVRADQIGLNKKIVFGGAKRFDIQNTSPLSTAEEARRQELLKKRGQ